MRIFRYIGELFLFRWLFSRLDIHKRENDALTNSRSYQIDEDSRRQIVMTAVIQNILMMLSQLPMITIMVITMSLMILMILMT